MRLQGKVACVAGCGSRMGRAIARLFAQEGAHVIGVSRNSETLSHLEKELRLLVRMVVERVRCSNQLQVVLQN